MSVSVASATLGTISDFTAGGVDHSGKTDVSTAGDGTVLGLSAQQRYFNPPISNVGTTFFAGTGQNNGLGGSSFQGALWNFDFYVKPGTAGYTYNLSYGLLGNATHSFNPLDDADATGFAAGTYQDSQNLLFSNFGGAANSFGSFDPSADATYEFILEALDSAGATVASSRIVVQVGKGSSVPDGGTSVALLGMALTAGAALRRKLA
ncbi:MAG TPA: VPDSG-CTERM sorting domain-containing protein [Verrucomicrobiae bacterium]|nr:VPDSG-CTERM sorting domain-containing protein [Verrucomicrobiae bacterium]